MIYKVFTIYDSKSETYLQPQYCKTKNECLRIFTDIVNSNDSQNQVAKHPEDYTLFEIGEYDDSIGSFSMLPASISLGNALEYKNQ